MQSGVGQHTRCLAAGTHLHFQYLRTYLNNKELEAFSPACLAPEWLWLPASTGISIDTPFYWNFALLWASVQQNLSCTAC